MLYLVKSRAGKLSTNKEQTTSVPITSFTPQGRKSIQEVICRELPLVIKVNSQEAATILCSPSDIEDLVFGLLYSEGFIESVEDIIEIDIDSAATAVSVKIAKPFEPKACLKPLIASGGSKGRSSQKKETEVVSGKLSVSTGQINILMSTFLSASTVYSATRGIHSAAIASPEKILIRRDDIGRHNALDKVFGSCLRNQIQTQNHLVIISGRISSEMLLKVAAHRSPILLTKAVPTDLGITLAHDLGITLVRCSHNLNITAYCHDWRITD